MSMSALADNDGRNPPQLSEWDRANFETLKRAAANGDLALLSVIRKSDGKPVAAVCAVHTEAQDGKTQCVVSPLAILVEGDPYEAFIPPGGIEDR